MPPKSQGGKADLKASGTDDNCHCSDEEDAGGVGRQQKDPRGAVEEA